MNKAIFTIILIVSSISIVYSQDTIVEVLQTMPTRFKVGDMIYADNFRGIKDLMTDIHLENPELYKELLPAYKQMRHKKNVGIIASGSIAAIGATLMIGSFTFWRRTETEQTFKTNGGFWATMEPITEEHKHFNFMLFLGGKVVFLSSLFVSKMIGPGESDFYNFINIHNKYTPGKKMQWKLGVNLNPTETLKFACRF